MSEFPYGNPLGAPPAITQLFFEVPYSENRENPTDGPLEFVGISAKFSDGVFRVFKSIKVPYDSRGLCDFPPFDATFVCAHEVGTNHGDNGGNSNNGTLLRMRVNRDSNLLLRLRSQLRAAGLSA
eukprot:comp42378_c0_seq1/m.66941 comp42378_c0_seq1/g.66941  ORF comp42378_c0_seq1/g.66941 comp42378_c0_seq1/m.66941 type:complete len:125 (-) comp42378_c0_seq1:21-395(-)